MNQLPRYTITAVKAISLLLLCRCSCDAFPSFVFTPSNQSMRWQQQQRKYLPLQLQQHGDDHIINNNDGNDEDYDGAKISKEATVTSSSNFTTSAASFPPSFARSITKANAAKLEFLVATTVAIGLIWAVVQTKDPKIIGFFFLALTLSGRWRRR